MQSKKIIVLPDGRISRKEAARYIGVTPGTMAVWDSIGKHGSYFQKRTVAGRVYYNFGQVQKFCQGDERDAA